MNRLMKTIVAGLALAQLTACSQEKTSIVADKSTMDAEQLALAGEQLVNPATFMLASRVFDNALEKDPTNKRAQFYQMFLKRLMVLEGIGSRIRPWAREYGDSVQLEKNASEFPSSPAKDFIYGGKEDLFTTTQVQNVLVEYRNALVEHHKWLRENQNLNLVLNLNPYVFSKEIQKSAATSCKVIDSSGYRIEVKCDYRDVAQRKINSADMIALRQMVAGEITYFTLYTSYSVEGIEQVLKLTGQGKKVTTAQKVALLAAQSNFGKLRSDNNLKILMSLGSDLLGALNWAIQNQPSLCPQTEPSYTYDYPNYTPRRPGMLFEEGICAQPVSEARKTAQLLESALSGAIQLTASAPNDPYKTVTYLVDPFVVSRKPIQDLKTLMPSSFNECGKPLTLADPTLGGIYPQGNAEQFLENGCN